MERGRTAAVVLGSVLVLAAVSAAVVGAQGPGIAAGNNSTTGENASWPWTFDRYDAGQVSALRISEDGQIVAFGGCESNPADDVDATWATCRIELHPNGTLASIELYQRGEFLEAIDHPDTDRPIVGGYANHLSDGGDDFLLHQDPARSGWEQTWNTGQREEHVQDLTVGPDGDVLVVGTLIAHGWGARVTADGTSRWTHVFDFGVRGVAVDPASDRLVFVQNEWSNRRTLHELYLVAPNGSEQREIHLEGWQNRGPRGSRTVTTDPLVIGDSIVVGTNAGSIVAFTANGTVRSRHQIADRIESLHRLPDGRIIAGVTTPNGTELRWLSENFSRLGAGPTFVGVSDVAPLDDRRLLVSGGNGTRPFVTSIPRRPPIVRVDQSPRLNENDTTTVDFDAAQSDAVLGRIIEYRWDFEDDGTVDAVSQSPRASHVYDQQGPSTVALTVVSDRGVRATGRRTVEVIDTRSPTPALAEPANRLVAADQPATLNASTSTDNVGIAAFRWDFDGDGSTDRVTRAPITTATYRGHNRSHEVALMVVDGANNTATRTFTLRSVPNDDPSVSIETVGFVVQRDPVTLEAHVEDRVGTLDRVEWHLPNGTVRTTNGTTIRYAFPNASSFEVRAVAVDEYGARGNATTTVEVRSRYPPDTGFVTIPPIVVLVLGLTVVALVIAVTATVVWGIVKLLNVIL